jgi:hypothetical protein
MGFRRIIEFLKRLFSSRKFLLSMSFIVVFLFILIELLMLHSFIDEKTNKDVQEDVAEEIVYIETRIFPVAGGGDAHVLRFFDIDNREVIEISVYSNEAELQVLRYMK